MQKITPHLWFDKQAREATEFYVSLIPGSKINSIQTITGTPSGDCDIVTFELAGQPFMAISAGPLFKFNPSVSFHIQCGTKEEVDKIWEQLLPGAMVMMALDKYPFSERYGWLADKYGLSWQVIYTDGRPVYQKLTPALMFVGEVAGKAEEAIRFYDSVFQGAPGVAATGAANVHVMSRYGPGEEPDKDGTVRYAHFTLLGQAFGAMDSAHPHKFAFNEAISFIVPCDTQEEIDYFWEKLSANPDAGQCGWTKDKYGLSWQVSATALGELMSGDKERTGRVTQAFLKMKKFDIGELRKAAAG